jgi:hypothetical protein
MRWHSHVPSFPYLRLLSPPEQPSSAFPFPALFFLLHQTSDECESQKTHTRLRLASSTATEYGFLDEPRKRHLSTSIWLLSSVNGVADINVSIDCRRRNGVNDRPMHRPVAFLFIVCSAAANDFRNETCGLHGFIFYMAVSY